MRRTAHSQMPACATRDCLTTTLERDTSSNPCHSLALAAARHPYKITLQFLPGPPTGAQTLPQALRASRTTSGPPAGAFARRQKTRPPPRSHGSHLYRETIWKGGGISYGISYRTPMAISYRTPMANMGKSFEERGLDTEILTVGRGQFRRKKVKISVLVPCPYIIALGLRNSVANPRLFLAAVLSTFCIA